MSHRSLGVALPLACALVAWLHASKAAGQLTESPVLLPSVSSSPGDSVRLGQLEEELAALRRELAALQSQQSCWRSNADLSANLLTPSESLIADRFHYDDAVAPATHWSRSTTGPSHFLTYDGGWVLRPRSPTATPFELQFNVHNQFRHTGFASQAETFTNSAGNTTTIKDRNDFDINRGRFVFSGFALDSKLRFYTNIDYNTVSERPVQLLLSWVSLQLSDTLVVSGGLGKVPGTWEWEESSRFTLGAERTMATTFFRPSITGGIWTSGQLRDGLYFRALIGDGFNTFTLRAAELDTNLAYSGMLWCEPWGDFGIGFSDLEQHENLVARLGQAFTYTRNSDDPSGEPGPEQTVIRISDGTPLVEPGALAPGTTVNQFDISLWALHFGLKYRGMSLATEYYLRWLTSLGGTAPLPVNSLFDHGFYVQGGVFVMPERLELYAIGSRTTGPFGDGYEAGGGLNWYWGGERGARFTLDAVYLDGSPAQQDRTGLVAGARGALLRTQLWTFF